MGSWEDYWIIALEVGQADITSTYALGSGVLRMGIKDFAASRHRCRRDIQRGVYWNRLGLYIG